MAVKRCFEGGTIQGKVTQLQGGVRRVAGRMSVTRDETRRAKLNEELTKLKEDVHQLETRMREHEDTCERCTEVREIQVELRNTTKRNARVAQMLYGTQNGDVTKRVGGVQ